VEAHSLAASVELRLSKIAHFGAMTDLRKKKSGEYFIGYGRPPSHSSAASFVDKGSSMTLALFLARKMHAIHRRVIELQ
jgi:hypothetical protein